MSALPAEKMGVRDDVMEEVEGEAAVHGAKKEGGERLASWVRKDTTRSRRWWSAGLGKRGFIVQYVYTIFNLYILYGLHNKPIHFYRSFLTHLSIHYFKAYLSAMNN